LKYFVWLLIITAVFICVFNVSAASKPEFTIKIGKLKLDGVKDADLDKKCTVFELTERINHAGGPLDNDSEYTVYVCYDKDNIYFACDADDDKVLSSAIFTSVSSPLTTTLIKLIPSQFLFLQPI